MAQLPDIASLWIGGKLSWLEQLCLKSFADRGHRITLYSYAPVDNLPAGVASEDAARIFPGEPLLRHAKNGSPAIHADVWRVHLLQKTDQIWVDADMYCYRPFDFPTAFIYGLEKPGLACNAVLGLPRRSRTLAGLLDFFSDEYAIAPWLTPDQRLMLNEARAAGNPVHMTDQPWGFTGPAAVTHFLQQTGEMEHAQPMPVFYPIAFRDRNKMILSRHNDFVDAHLTAATRGVHFWARRMKPRLQEAEHNRPRRGSFLHRLLQKHEIDPAAAPIPAKSLPKDAMHEDPAIQA